jgi:hypothetical protein
MHLNETIVHEHGDPGLISLAINKSESGLCMYDNTNQSWVVVPQNTITIWYGTSKTKYITLMCCVFLRICVLVRACGYLYILGVALLLKNSAETSLE